MLGTEPQDRVETAPSAACVGRKQPPLSSIVAVPVLPVLARLSLPADTPLRLVPFRRRPRLRLRRRVSRTGNLSVLMTKVHDADETGCYTR